MWRLNTFSVLVGSWVGLIFHNFPNFLSLTFSSTAMSGAGTAVPATVVLPPGHFQIVAVPPTSGVARLEPRFLAALQAAKVPDDKLEILGIKEIANMAMVANICRDL